jgi:anthranilate phosphoribosyltransferase
MMKHYTADWVLDASKLDAFMEARLSEEHMLEALRSLHPANVSSQAYTELHHYLWSRQLSPLPQFSLRPNILMDVCGTGGSGIHGFNTSTTVAFVLASLGVSVIKFGNRAATSPSGSFDFLEALGLPTPLPLAIMPTLVEETGLGFVMGPQVYPQLAKLAPFRKALGQPTAFNMIGPLLNPYLPTHRLMGCANEGAMPVLARALFNMKRERRVEPRHSKTYAVLKPHLEMQGVETMKSMILRSENGLDEALTSCPFQTLTVDEHGIHFERFTPVALPPPVLEGDADFSSSANVKRFYHMIHREDTTSSAYHQVCLNAALGYHLAFPQASIEEGMALVAEALATERVKRFTEHFLATVKKMTQV